MHTHTLATHGLEVRRQLVAGLGPQLGGGARTHVALQLLKVAAQRHAVDQDLQRGVRGAGRQGWFATLGRGLGGVGGRKVRGCVCVAHSLIAACRS